MRGGQDFGASAGADEIARIHGGERPRRQREGEGMKLRFAGLGERNVEVADKAATRRVDHLAVTNQIEPG